MDRNLKCNKGRMEDLVLDAEITNQDLAGLQLFRSEKVDKG